MHRSETLQFIECLLCNAEVSLGLDRCFAITEETGLCFRCAVERGGVYDELHDTWTRAPHLDGLRRPDDAV